jgi:hypothetical protein
MVERHDKAEEVWSKGASTAAVHAAQRQRRLSQSAAGEQLVFPVLPAAHTGDRTASVASGGHTITRSQSLSHTLSAHAGVSASTPGAPATAFDGTPPAAAASASIHAPVRSQASAAKTSSMSRRSAVAKPVSHKQGSVRVSADFSKNRAIAMTYLQAPQSAAKASKRVQESEAVRRGRFLDAFGASDVYQDGVGAGASASSRCCVGELLPLKLRLGSRSDVFHVSHCHAVAQCLYPC